MSISELSQKYACYCKKLDISQKETLKENKAKIYILASNQAYIIKIDGGMFAQIQKEQKSDYLAYTSSNTYIIELKGKCNINEAYKQILSTIKILLQQLEYKFLIENREMLMAYIIGPRRPRGKNKYEMTLFKELIRHSKNKSKKSISDFIKYMDRGKNNLTLE